jgi:hypothetical protein
MIGRAQPNNAVRLAGIKAFNAETGLLLGEPPLAMSSAQTVTRWVTVYKRGEGVLPLLPFVLHPSDTLSTLFPHTRITTLKTNSSQCLRTAML